MCLAMVSLDEALTCVGYWSVMSAEDDVAVFADVVERNTRAQENQVVDVAAAVVDVIVAVE